MATPLIQLKNISKTFGDSLFKNDTLVLNSINLEIWGGEFVILFGPSGSGKSTLLNIIAGLEKPSVGQVIVRESDLNQLSSDELAKFHRQKMGMVFQSFNLIKSLSVWENVALPQVASGNRHKPRRERALELLRMLGIEEYADRFPTELSGGEQQRVAIARALINNPFVLLVDEPTGNLDSKSADDVMNIIVALNRRFHHTILLVTHNPNHIPLATRVIHMQDGKIVRTDVQQAEPATVQTGVS